jgi:hypothetical protein
VLQAARVGLQVAEQNPSRQYPSQHSQELFWHAAPVGLQHLPPNSLAQLGFGWTWHVKGTGDWQHMAVLLQLSAAVAQQTPP